MNQKPNQDKNIDQDKTDTTWALSSKGTISKPGSQLLLNDTSSNESHNESPAE